MDHQSLQSCTVEPGIFRPEGRQFPCFLERGGRSATLLNHARGGLLNVEGGGWGVEKLRLVRV
jgi:hypothetical protein